MATAGIAGLHTSPAQPRPKLDPPGSTVYLKHGGTLERAAAIVNHASIRTMQLYGRRSDKVNLDEIERIVI